MPRDHESLPKLKLYLKGKEEGKGRSGSYRVGDGKNRDQDRQAEESSWKTGFPGYTLPSNVQGEDMKRNPDMGETTIQPAPAQTADLSISGLRFMYSPCIHVNAWPLKKDQ